MRFIKLIFLYIFSACVPVFILSGCIYENYNEEQPAVDSEFATVILHLRSINEDFPMVEEIKEKVADLRIVILDGETNLIEYNNLIDLSEVAVKKDNELYDFYYRTSPGKKKFYFFANEESMTSVEGMSFGDNETIDVYSLSDFLSDTNYKAGSQKGDEFETRIKGLYFTPEYNIYCEDDPEKKIKLPYSSFYEIHMQAGDRYEQPMYLLPVATKFDVIISNKRNDKITVTDLSITSFARKNYILAQVEEPDYTKDGIYWVDWLAKISQESQKYPGFEDNVGFNNLNGWISHYNLPDKTHLKFDLVTPENPILIDEQTTQAGGDPIPGEFVFTTFYMPESYFTPEDQDESTQSYSLELTLKDGTNTEVKFTRKLSNIKNLFRNTHAVINIVFNAGYMHVYGEIIPWNFLDVVNGYVTEETEE